MDRVAQRVYLGTSAQANDRRHHSGSGVPFVTFERRWETSASRPDDGALKPAKCPECGSTKLGTLATIITSDTYWRCHQCGTVWNALRYRQQHKRQW